MTRGIIELSIFFVSLLLCHATLLMTRSTPLGDLVARWVALALPASTIASLCFCVGRLGEYAQSL